MNIKINFESTTGPANVPLEQATFEQILQVRDRCNELLGSLDLEALKIA